MKKLKDEYIKENGLYFLGSFINNRVNDGVHMNYQDLTIDYEMVEKHKFDELSFASLLHTITKVIPESKNMREDLFSYRDGVDWYEDKEKVLKLLFNKLMPLDFNKVWLNIDIDDYCDINELIFKTIMKMISLDSFINKVEKCDDIELVYELYMFYGKIHNISIEEMYKNFVLYLDGYIVRNENTYEELFLYYFATYRSEGKLFYKELVNLLFSKINMDYVIDKKNEKTTLLKNKIATKLYFGEHDKSIINTFLNLNPGIYFEDNCLWNVDIFQLNLIAGDIEKAKEIFDSDVYELYSLEQYNALKNDGYYDIEKYGRPIKRLRYILNTLHLRSTIERDKRKSVLIELLYSDKVKMINRDDLTIIELILGDEEYNKFMQHVIQNNILVYTINSNNQIYCVNFNKEKYFVEVIDKSNFSTTEFKIVDDNAYAIFRDFMWQLNRGLPEERRELEDRTSYRVKLVGENLLPIIDVTLADYEYEKIIDYMLQKNILAHYRKDKKEKKFERVRKFLGNKGIKAE